MSMHVLSTYRLQSEQGTEELLVKNTWTRHVKVHQLSPVERLFKCLLSILLVPRRLSRYPA